MSKKEKDPAQPRGEEGGGGLQPLQPPFSNVPGSSYQMAPQRADDQSMIDAAIKKPRSSIGYAKRSFNIFRNKCHDFLKDKDRPSLVFRANNNYCKSQIIKSCNTS